MTIGIPAPRYMPARLILERPPASACERGASATLANNSKLITRPNMTGGVRRCSQVVTRMETYRLPIPIASVITKATAVELRYR
jgi:hypothetical protein